MDATNPEVVRVVESGDLWMTQVEYQYSIRWVGPFATKLDATEYADKYRAGDVRPPPFIPHSARMELAQQLGHGGPIRDPRKYFDV